MVGGDVQEMVGIDCFKKMVCKEYQVIEVQWRNGVYHEHRKE